MRYERPTLPPEDRRLLLREYLDHYGTLARKARSINDFETLSRKLPKGASQQVLNKVDELLHSEATRLANEEGPIKRFLEENSLPPMIETYLTIEYRAFCLLLNSLKQWVSAEQNGTDKYLLGGNARDTLREASEVCIVTGNQLSKDKIELHHPVRDGRPPLPLSSEGHSIVDKSESGPQDEISTLLRPLKKRQHGSWKMLRRGLLLLRDHDAEGGTENTRQSAKTFARKAIEETAKNAAELLEWLNENELGL